MAEKRSKHKGMEIVIRESKGPATIKSTKKKSKRPASRVTLKIAGKTVEVTRIGPKQFVSSQLPYRAYKSLEALAKDIVDKSPEFYPHATDD